MDERKTHASLIGLENILLRAQIVRFVEVRNADTLGRSLRDSKWPAGTERSAHTSVGGRSASAAFLDLGLERKGFGAISAAWASHQLLKMNEQ